MRKVLVLSLALILLLGIMSGGTSSYFSDTETSAGNTFTAWIGCEQDSLIIVSDTNTMVTEVNNAPITPQNAVLAWEPCNLYPICDTSAIEDDPSLWDNTIIYGGAPYTFLNGADWIWDTRLTSDPGGDAAETGWVVQFERTFTIPCSPRGATLDMAVDNGYTVWINGTLVGCAQVDSGGVDLCIGWETSDLTEPYVHTSGWQTVKRYTIPSTYLVVGTNTLVILAANEQMPDGTAENNPAGLIYWLEVEWGD